MSDERKVSFLRVNFYSPNDKSAKTTATPAVLHALQNKYDQVFVKELVYRSENARGLADQVRQIKQLQKDFRASKRENEEVSYSSLSSTSIKNNCRSHTLVLVLF